MVSGVAKQDPIDDAPICHLNLAPDYRGGERQTEVLIRELANRGFAQRLVVRRGGPLPHRCSNIGNLDIREVAANPLAVGLAIKGSRVSHAHDGRTVYSAWLGKRLFSVPYVITRRVVAPQSAKIVRRWAYREASRFVAISDVVAVAVARRFADLDITVIADSVSNLRTDADAVAAIRLRYSGKTLIGHVGALDDSHKGQATIIDAARIAAEKFPQWHFLICGEGQDRARYEQAIGGLDNIELVGFVDNVGDYLACFDIFLYPSLHEALGSALLDAMQYGVPIVASNVDGIPAVVEDGVNGRLIEPRRPEALVEAIETLLSDTPSLQQIRRSNVAKAGHYAPERMADGYTAIYSEISTPSQS